MCLKCLHPQADQGRCPRPGPLLPVPRRTGDFSRLAEEMCPLPCTHSRPLPCQPCQPCPSDHHVSLGREVGSLLTSQSSTHHHHHHHHQPFVKYKLRHRYPSRRPCRYIQHIHTSIPDINISIPNMMHQGCCQESQAAAAGNDIRA